MNEKEMIRMSIKCNRMAREIETAGTDQHPHEKRSSWSVWLMLLLMAASAVLIGRYETPPGEGAGAGWLRRRLEPSSRWFG